MAAEVVAGSTLATALQNVIQPKLSELGWSATGDDSGLAEYIVLMLVSGKTKEQITTELANDFLDVNPSDPAVVEFAQWVFEQLAMLQAPASRTEPAPAQVPPPQQSDEVSSGIAQDATMEESGSNEPEVYAPHNRRMLNRMRRRLRMQTESLKHICRPTGPKSMRGGHNQRFQTRRMLGHMNRALDRSNDGAMHRIKGGQGEGRIDTHSRQAPRGPTPRGPRGGGNRAQQIQRMMQGQQGMGQPFAGPASPGGTPFGNMDANQAMQWFAMMEQGAQMMQQAFSQGQVNPQQAGGFNAGFGGGANPNGGGKSLFERVQRPNRGNSRHPQENGAQSQPDEDMDTDAPENSTGNGLTSSMEVEGGSRPDPENSVCRFNLSCTKPDCSYAHQSPAAPPGVSIDLSDTCSFGPACKNPKCTGKHPSPAQRQAHLASVDCKFYPNCTNPSCPFRHPSMPPCRNGADCAVEGCKFVHSKVQCKFNPCLNPHCMFKHAENQKGSYPDKVWTKDGEPAEEKGHVSERRFVDDEEAPEDLILPGQGDRLEALTTEGFVE